LSVRNYLTSIRKHWLWVVFLTLLVTAGVAAVSMTTPPVYKSTAVLFVSMNTGRSATDLNQGAAYTQSQMSSFGRMASMPVVLEPVVEDLGLNVTARQLARNISTESAESMLFVSATSGSPEMAQMLAQAVANVLSTQIEEVSPKIADGDREVSTVLATVVDPAAVPSSPSAPNTVRNVMAAMFAGLLLGLLAAVLRDVLDTRVRTREDVDSTAKVPVLGIVAATGPRRRNDKNESRALRSDGPQAEDVRRVRANLQMVGRVDESQVFVFSSALPGEGKSFCATHAAAAFAAAGSRVLLIDADLRRPTVATYLGISGHAGLTEVLLGRGRFGELCQQYAPNLAVLASGAIPPNPAELLSSPAFADLIDLVRKHFEVIVIDSPPLLPVADAIAVSRVATGVVMVVDVTRTRRAQLVQSVEAVRLGGGRVLGAILNRTKMGEGSSSAYGYSSRQETDEDRAYRQARLDAAAAAGRHHRPGVATETSDIPIVASAPRPRR